MAFEGATANGFKSRNKAEAKKSKGRKAMKVLIITIHNIVNFGSLFQARGLQKYISDQGYDCEIINYNPSYLSHTGIKAELGKMLNFCYFVPRKRKFQSFLKTEMRLTKKNYHSLHALEQDPPEADLMIVGGDQLWNEFYPCGRVPAFRLTFTKVAKAAFGTSLGKRDYTPEGLRQLAVDVGDYKAIGIREKSGMELLQRAGLSEVKNVCDPVFLLQKSDYGKYVKKPLMEEPYLFVYLVAASPLLEQAVKLISKKLHLKVVLNTGFVAKCKYDLHVKDMGPDECLNYLANATYVLSGSFHASAFSIMFHKQFLTLLPGQNTNARIEDLLDLVGLKERMMSDASQLDDSVFEAIDWERVDASLNGHIEQSKRFLDHILQGVTQDVHE